MSDKRENNLQERLNDNVSSIAAVFGDEELSRDVNGFLSDIFNHNRTEYDRAIDAAHVRDGIGSSSTL